MIQFDGLKLTQLRMKRKLKQREAAARIGVSRPTMSRAEAGLRLHALTAEKFLDFYRVPLSAVKKRETAA